MRLCVVVGVLLAAGPARAVGEGGSAVAEFLFQAFNLALLVAVIIYFARKPVRAFFIDRRERVRGELDRAAALLDEAQQRFSSWQHRLAELDGELEGIRASGRRRAEEERERILADAQTSAERIRAEAGAAIEQELRRARAALREEAAKLAVELAGELLIQELGDRDHERLVTEFTERVESKPAAPASPARRS